MTKKNVYPLPNIDDMLESLSGNTYFSQLDMASGYWQVPMSERSKEYTAFRTQQGLYQFKVMPFGLTNAPASYQRLMNALFSGLKGLQLQIFIDDICIATKSWKEHIEMLEKVFTLIRRAKLKLKSKKCVLGSSKIIFLGHELSRAGIRQDPDKLKAMTSIPIPTNVKEVQRLLGLFNYYRRFVPNFSQIASPLHKLTKKNQEFTAVVAIRADLRSARHRYSSPS